MNKINVLIGSRNGLTSLMLVLDSLQRQTLSYNLFDVTVMLCDDDDSVYDQIRPLSDQLPYGLNVFHTPKPEGVVNAKTIALNFGVSTVTGDILLFCDQDTFLSKNHLEVHLGWHEEYPDGTLLVTSPIFSIIRPIPLAMYSMYANLKMDKIEKLYENLCVDSDINLAIDTDRRVEYPTPSTEYFIPGHVFSITRNTFHLIGGWDENFANTRDGSCFTHMDIGSRHMYAANENRVPKFCCPHDIAHFHLWHEVRHPDFSSAARYYQEKHSPR